MALGAGHTSCSYYVPVTRPLQLFKSNFTDKPETSSKGTPNNLLIRKGDADSLFAQHRMGDDPEVRLIIPPLAGEAVIPLGACRPWNN